MDRRVSRANVVYARLRALIADLELAPGTPLSENQVSARLGVSRTPVREALHRLEQEGLVRRAWGGSLVVAELTCRDVGEICDLIELLDLYLFRRAASRLDDGAMQRLRGYADAMREAARSGDVDAWSAADQSFHELLQEAADNRNATELVDRLRRRLHRFWVGSARRQQRLEDCSREHVAIVDALAAGDLERLEALVREHVSHMRESLLAMLAAAAPLLRRADTVEWH